MKILFPPRTRSVVARGILAFTLVEMLIVVGIILVLVALAVPVTLKMINHSKSVKCLSNLRQLAVGIQAYVGDNNGMYPLGITSDYKTWVDRTIPYVGQNTRGKSVWLCPAAPLPIDSDNTSLYGNSYAFSYAMNDGLASIPNDNSKPQVRTVTITYPSEVILVADATQSASNKNLPAATLYRPQLLYSPLSKSRMNDLVPMADCEGYGSLSYQHPNNVCNALMCDGSARGFKRGEVCKKNFVATVNP